MYAFLEYLSFGGEAEGKVRGYIQLTKTPDSFTERAIGELRLC